MTTETLTVGTVEPTSAPFVLLRAGAYKRGDREVEITEADLDRAIENFEEDRESGYEVALDYDHSFMRGGSSRASGWLRSLVKRSGELLASVRWTEAARDAIKRGEYKYVSAEFDRSHTTEDGRERGFAIVSGGITNRPFLRDLGEVALTAEPIPVGPGPTAEPEPLDARLMEIEERVAALEVAAAVEAPPPPEAAERLREVEALVASGDCNLEAATQQLRACELMAERGLDYPAACAQAWTEMVR